MLQSNRKEDSLFSPQFVSVFRLMLFLVFSILLMVFDRTTDYLDRAKSMLNTAVYPILSVAASPGEVSEAISAQFQSQEAMQEELARLLRENFLLKTQNQRLTSLEAENNRLRSLMKSSSNVPQSVIIAEIMSVAFDPYRHVITLNRGQVDGVHAGQSLIADKGIVGQVDAAYRNHATAVLISDPSHTVPVQIDRNGIRALLKGRGRFQSLLVDTVQNYDDVKVGDELITSGLGGRFPRGYPIATVTSVEFNPASPFAHIVAEPTVKLDRLREVLLVVSEQETALGDALVGPFKTP